MPDDTFVPPGGAQPLSLPWTANIRTVQAGDALAWIRQGWEYFLRAPGVWALLFVLFLIFTLGLSAVPFVGLMNGMLVPVFVGGLMYACRAIDRGEQLELRHVIDGFQQHTANLLFLGLLNLAFTVAAAILITIVVAATVGATALTAAVFERAGGIAAFGGMVFVVLFVIAVTIPITMAMWFAPALVAFHDVPPVEAIRLSFIACGRNIAAFLLYGLVVALLLLLAMLPLGLGLIVMVPTVWASIYVSYVEIFENEAPGNHPPMRPAPQV